MRIPDRNKSVGHYTRVTLYADTEVKLAAKVARNLKLFPKMEHLRSYTETVEVTFIKFGL